jgi:uncharacterized membrane protein
MVVRLLSLNLNSMKPLVVLVIVSLSSFLILCLSGHCNVVLSARIGMAGMLLFTAIGHFKFLDGMVMMMPRMIPFKRTLVLLTGLLEVLAAGGLLYANTVKLTCYLLIIFFILILPVNINAAMKHIDHEKASFSGPGSTYLWFRVPLQILFILWVYMVSRNY